MAPELQPSAGRQKGSKNYSKEEVKALLLRMQDMLPGTTDQWTRLAQAHAEKWPDREVESIKRKYNTLYRKKVPVGDSVPWEVRMAKKIRRDILLKDGKVDTFEAASAFDPSGFGDSDNDGDEEEEEEDIQAAEDETVSSVGTTRSAKRSYIPQQSQEKIFKSIADLAKRLDEREAKQAQREARQAQREANQAQREANQAQREANLAQLQLKMIQTLGSIAERLGESPSKKSRNS